MIGKIKLNTVDRYLLPIRKQITELIKPGSSVNDYGCGNGNFLFNLSHKIKIGTGFDNAKSLISYANKRKSVEGVKNIDFMLIDLCKNPFPNNKVNYSIATLLLHVISKNDASFLLKHMINTSEVTILCGFSKPKNWKQSFLLYMDQRFSGHYSEFKMYRENNYMEGLLESLTHVNYKTISTFDPVIKIYKITKRIDNYE